MSRLLDRLDGDARDRLEEEPVPGSADPMLATLVHDPFSDPRWIYERKLDGERCLAFRDRGRVRLRSRGDQDLSGTYPELVDPLLRAPENRFVVDGEVVAFEGSVTSFARLQERMQIDDPGRARATGVAVYYYVFDLLHAGGWSTTDLELRDRKRLLRGALEYADPIRFTPHRNEDGERFFAEACERGWEGLIAKDAASGYAPGRSRSWQKLKCSHRQELVVGGFTEPSGEREHLGALLVGYYEGDDLTYAGKVGTGFGDETLRALRDRLDRLERDTPAFAGEEAPSGGVHWVEPRLVVEIGFTEWTRAGRLRHPRYLGLRRDKEPGQVVREAPA